MDPDLCPVEALHALDDRRPALYVDIGSHLAEFLGMVEPALIDGLGYYARPIRHRQQAHHRRLEIRGKPRVGKRPAVDRQRAPLGSNVDRARAYGDVHARLPEFREQGTMVFGDDIGHVNRAGGDRRGEHEGARLDPVGNRGIGGAMELAYSLDDNRIVSRSLDPGAHRVKKPLQVLDLRLLGRVADDGRAARERRRENHILGGADAWQFKVHFAAGEDGGAGLDPAVSFLHVGAQ